MHRTTFYTVGGTVQASGGRYVTRSVDTELIENCRRGDFSFVLTARQMGKSSLMVRTAENLAAQGVRSVIVDLSQVGVQVTEDAWYLGILTRIEDSLELDTDVYGWWDDQSHLGMSQRFTQFFEEVVLQEVVDSLVVFMDEIDSTLSLPFTDDFFAAIRYMYNARSSSPAFERLSFVLVGVATPSDLISDPSRTPFNIGKQVDVDYFTNEEALPLSDGFGVDEEKSRQLLGWILKWTNGHPFLTQRLSAIVAERGPASFTESDVEKVVQQTFFGDQSEHDSNLRFVHDMLTRRADDPVAVLSTYSQILKGKRVQDDRQSSAVTHLKLSGVVGRQNGRLGVRNRIYARVFDAEWLARQWPEHWLKRVPPAVRGLVVASFATVVLLAAFFVQKQQTNAAEERESLLQAASDSLAFQVSITASLNDSLRVQNVELDSLNLAQDAANAQLRIERDRADSLAQVEAAARIELGDQFTVIESLNGDLASVNVGLQTEIETSDSLRLQIQSQLDAATSARLETLTLALANAARRQQRLGNAELGALLARQAFHFSRRGEGRYKDPIYDALTSTLNAVSVNDEAAPAGGPVVVGPLQAGVESLAVDAAGSSVVAGLENGAIEFFELQENNLLSNGTIQAHTGAVRAVAFVPQSADLVTAGEDGIVRLWRPGEDGSYNVAATFNLDGMALSLSVSSDGRLIAAGSSSGDVHVYRLESLSNAYTYSVPGFHSVRALAFREQDNALAIGADDASISLADPERGSIIAQWSTSQGRILTLSFHPLDGSLASGGDGTFVQRWSLASPSRAIPFGDPFQGHEGPVSSISTSVAMMASGSYDHSIQIWDLVDIDFNSIILQGHTGWVESIAILDAGTRLVSSGADRTVRLWNLDLGLLATRVCTVVTNNELTPEEWDQFVGPDIAYLSEYIPCSATASSSDHRQ